MPSSVADFQACAARWRQQHPTCHQSPCAACLHAIQKMPDLSALVVAIRREMERVASDVEAHVKHMRATIAAIRTSWDVTRFVSMSWDFTRQYAHHLNACHWAAILLYLDLPEEKRADALAKLADYVKSPRATASPAGYNLREHRLRHDLRGRPFVDIQAELLVVLGTAGESQRVRFGRHYVKDERGHVGYIPAEGPPGYILRWLLQCMASRPKGDRSNPPKVLRKPPRLDTPEALSVEHDFARCLEAVLPPQLQSMLRLLADNASSAEIQVEMGIGPAARWKLCQRLRNHTRSFG